MPPFTRPFPPPPPPRESTPAPEQQPEPVQEQTKDKKLSAKTKFGLLIAGGVLSLAIAATCIVLIFIL